MHSDAEAALTAAEAAGKKPDATSKEIAAYNEAKSLALTYYYLKRGAINSVASLQAKQAELPQMHQNAQELAATAAQAQVIADQKKDFARARKAESDAAEAAAQPLPKVYASGGDGI